jgi:hypothetical protein
MLFVSALNFGHLAPVFLWLLFLQPFIIQVPEQPHKDAMGDILGSCILLQFEGG